MSSTINLCLVILLSFILFGCISLPGPKINEKNEPHSVQNTSQRDVEVLVNMTQNPLPTKNTQDVMTTDTKFPELPKFNFTNVTTKNGKLIVYYFLSPHCGACVALRPEITKLEAKYTNVLWLEYDITTQNGTLAYTEFAQEKNLSIDKRLVPQVLVNGTVITDRFAINESLEGILNSTFVTQN